MGVCDLRDNIDAGERAAAQADLFQEARRAAERVRPAARKRKARHCGAPVPYLPTLSKKPQKSHQKGMELPDPCRYFLRKLCGVLVAYFVLL